MNVTPVPILLVDDRRENLVALAALLDEIDGLELVQATSGAEALRMMLTRDFGLVLMDVQMPEMDGFEAAALARANPKTRHVPIIFVTAASDGADFAFRGYESGAVDYLVKPIEPIILNAKVRVFVNLYRQQQAMNEHKRYLAHVEELVEKRTGSRFAQDELLRVLLIDDRQENLVALEALLSEFEDLTIVKAASGPEAMRAIVRDEFALVLLDVQMPGMNGYEIAEQIHNNQKSRLVPIIFITAALNERETVARGYQHGAVDYLIKPLDPAIVKSKVRVFCDLYRHRLAIEKHNVYLEILAADRTAALQRSTAELVDSRERYRRLAEKLELATRAAGIGIWDWNVVTNELVWDARMYELYGVRPEHFGGAYETWLASVHPDDRGRCDTAVQQALANKLPYDIEFRIRLTDGTLRDIKGDGKVIFDSEGRAVRMSGVNYDITARKRAEKEVLHHRDGLLELVDERTATLNAIVDHAPDGIVTVDQNGRILSFNAAAERMFGYAAGDVIGREGNLLVPAPHRFLPEEYSQAGSEAGEGHALEAGRELLGQRQDGSVFPLYLAVSAMDVRGQRRYTSIARDISSQKALEARLIQAREAAEVANRSKSDFLANMSHEIRTPMNAVIGMTHLALQTDLTPKQRNYLDNVDRAAQGLLGVINDILDFSKIEAGKLLFEHTDFMLSDVLDHIATLFVIKAREKKLELLFDIHSNVPQALIGDPLRLQQVLMNLVGNAIKFTERGEVVVSVSRLERGKGNVALRFEVKDTGIGISPAQSSRLFSAFVQADSSTTRTYGGSGLGLSISKKLVEMMGGQLTLKSELGVGSRFIFTAHFGTQGTQRAPKAMAPDLRGMRVLIVDDNTVARNILVSIVESLQFQVGTVNSALEAIEELRAAHDSGLPYQVMLMDWSMPSMNGLEAVRRIRAGELAVSPIIIMVTALSREKLLESAQGVKLDGVLEKPVTAHSVLDAIGKAISKDQAQAGPERPRRDMTYEEAREQVNGARVLLVEDNQINQELALDILTSAGVKVDLAANGAEAVERVARDDYDAVLMDCQMPVMDGYEATRQIRLEARHHDLPILAMTANAMVGDREKCLAAGMNAHIPKPIDVNQLFRVLARWIKPRGLRRAAGNAAGVNASAARPMPQLPGVDMEAVMKRLAGNSGQYRRLLTMFYRGQANAVDRVRNAWDGGNRQEAQREAHNLKGLAASVGANALAEAAAVLEYQLAGAVTQERLNLALDEVKAPLDTLIEALETFLKQE